MNGDNAAEAVVMASMLLVQSWWMPAERKGIKEDNREIS